jgi:hypothetical protein
LTFGLGTTLGSGSAHPASIKMPATSMVIIKGFNLLLLVANAYGKR